MWGGKGPDKPIMCRTQKKLDKNTDRNYNNKKPEGGMRMPKIDAQLGIRVTKDLKSRLEQQARREMSSVSALIVRVMEEYLQSKGNGKQT